VSVRARRTYTLRTRLEDLQGVSASELRGLFGDGGDYELTGQTVTHEDHPPVAESSDAAARRGPLDANRLALSVDGIALHHRSLLKRQF
jgi:hypothetical protein